MSRRLEKAEKAISEAFEKVESSLKALFGGGELKSLKELVWEAYSMVEYAVFSIKLELGVEGGVRRGRLEGEARVEDLLVKASDGLLNALRKLRDGEARGALEEARGARDSLRSVLVRMRGLV